MSCALSSSRITPSPSAWDKETLYSGDAVKKENEIGKKHGN
jgi:hypothetical protein